MTEATLLPCDPQTLGALTRAVTSDNVDQALEQLEATIARHPYDARLYLLRGSILASAEAMDLARADFSRSALLSPALDEARFMLGQLEYAAGHPHEAWAIWAPFRASGADASATAHLGAAMLWLMEGDDASSRRHLETALTLSPSDAIRDHIERLLARFELNESVPSGPDDTTLPHFLVTDYLSGQTRH
jgi:tetratricopeptide (TPR) repeat protein